MKYPDLELLHQIKGKLEERLESMPESSLKRRAGDHLKRSIARAERGIEGVISGAVDDVFYIDKVLEAAEVENQPASSDGN